MISETEKNGENPCENDETQGLFHLDGFKTNISGANIFHEICTNTASSRTPARVFPVATRYFRNGLFWLSVSWFSLL